MCLCIQELNLIERVVTQKEPLPSVMEEDLAEDAWTEELVKDKEIANILQKLEEVQWMQDEVEDLGTAFAKQHRKGLEVFRARQLFQYQYYLKGFYFHSVNKFDDALRFYSDSLKVGETFSVSALRLEALENIEMIIRDRRQAEKAKKAHSLRSRFDKRELGQPQVWRTKNMIYKCLSHHYVL